MKPDKRLRCAIYTRVSTEHGLEQEFNSLDAQREAAEAYVKSQSHEGWLCLRDRFDDGGYSGGSLERPALQSLLDTVKARCIDVIVVYKVDRLTRSLADFAKLVELFDNHDVSFVSVTQSFNTTSSMGRLTLNVLLSFAQFEREVTGERIRDKIAASKKKGIWMGGIVPYGYRLENRKLFIDPPEAEKVRHIFELYLDIKSLPKLSQTLARKGMVSRSRAFVSGEPVGGKPFRTGALSHLLGNRMYLGEVNHRGKSYPAEHDAIISQDLFDAVQNLLTQRKTRRRSTTGHSGALLQGLIYDDKGNRMTPVHATKGSARYRYYQSWVLGHGQKDKAGSVSRVPAGDIEQMVVDALASRFPERVNTLAESEARAGDIRALITRVTIHSQHISVECQAAASECASDKSTSDPELVASGEGLIDRSGLSDTNPQSGTMTISWMKPASTRRRQILHSSESPRHAKPLKSETRSRILAGIALGRLWLDQLASRKVPDIASLARQHDRSEKSVRSMISLAFLAPDIVEAVMANQLARGLGISDLTDLPPDWVEQRRQLSAFGVAGF